MNSLASRVVLAAVAAVGLREEGGPNRGPPVDLYAGGRREPWCGHFVASIFREEGSPLPGDVAPSAGVHNPIAQVSAMHRECELAGLLVAQPQAGDVVFFSSRAGSDTGAGWHVGIVSACLDDIVQTIEGNSGDAVARQRYRVGDKRIAGYARQR